MPWLFPSKDILQENTENPSVQLCGFTYYDNKSKIHSKEILNMAGNTAALSNKTKTRPAALHPIVLDE